MKLRLLCPGLFGRYGWSAEGLRETPNLDLLLARGDIARPSTTDPLAALAGAFGLDPAQGDLPSAALSLLADAPDIASRGHWVHADPICLTADRDRLLLFGGPRLELRREESDALVDALNAHFADDGLVLVAPRPSRWYLRAATPVRAHALPLYRVHGLPLDRPRPRNSDERTWLRWQTEAQMLLHAHPVNRARESAGKMPVNGLWTWGDGALPTIRPDAAPDLLVGEHPLALGLARWADIPARSLGALSALLDSQPLGQDSNVVAFWDRLWWAALDGDWGSWTSEVEALESLAGQIVGALRAKRISMLILEDGERCAVSVRRSHLRRFWRPRRGLCERLGKSGERPR